MHTDFVVVTDRMRAAYQSEPEYLEALVERINVSIRTLLMSMVGRDLPVVDPVVKFEA